MAIRAFQERQNDPVASETLKRSKQHFIQELVNSQLTKPLLLHCKGGPMLLKKYRTLRPSDIIMVFHSGAVTLRSLPTQPTSGTALRFKTSR